MNCTFALAHESQLSEKLDEVMYLLKVAQEERERGQGYVMLRQGCVENILDDMAAAEFVEELADHESDLMAKDSFLSQAAFRHTEASANMKMFLILLVTPQ